MRPIPSYAVEMLNIIKNAGFEAYAVGDCDEPYNIQYAVRAGNFCARVV